MKPLKIVAIMLFGLISVAGIASCSNVPTISKEPVLTTTMATPTPTLTLATPYAQEPAAGICASFDSETVTITLNPDISDPRCTKIQPDQKLSVVNSTLSTLQVSIGNFKRSMLPGETWSIDVPFADYLAPGVHQLTVEPCCSAELWLEGK